MTSERHVIVIGCLQENTEFPVTEYYGAQTSTTTTTTTKKIKTSFYEKEGGKEATEKDVHNERGGWRGRKDT